MLPDLASADCDIHKILLIILMIRKTRIKMRLLLSSKKAKAIFGIGLIAISIGAISKKVISYPTEGCINGVSRIDSK